VEITKYTYTYSDHNIGPRVVVTDIDGTITESDVKGVVLPQLGIDAHQVCTLAWEQT
jgi:phosphatidate phosphatase PAH1